MAMGLKAVDLKSILSHSVAISQQIEQVWEIYRFDFWGLPLLSLSFIWMLQKECDNGAHNREGEREAKPTAARRHLRTTQHENPLCK